MPNAQSGKRPRRYFGVHYRLLRFLGLGWWHHPDENNFNNFPGLYIYYTILTEIVWVAGFVGLETIDPFVGEKDIDRFMFSLSFVITHDLTCIKLYVFFFKNRAIQEIVRTIEIEVYDYYQNIEKNRRTIRITKIMTASFIFFGWITIGNTNVYGTIMDLRWKREVSLLNDTTIKPLRTLPQPIYIPWKYQSDSSYIATFVLETVGLLWTGHIVMIIDTFIGSVILHMSTQFAILQEAFITAYHRALTQLLSNMPIDINTKNLIISDSGEIDIPGDKLDEIEAKVKTFYTDIQIESEIEKSVMNCLRQHQLLIRPTSVLKAKRGSLCVDLQYLRITALILSAKLFYAYLYQHNTVLYTTLMNFEMKFEDSICLRLLSCVEKFRDTYSYGFMTQLMSSMAAICVVMVQVSQDASSFKSIRLVTSLAFFVAMIIQLAIQCFTANELTFQAAKVSDAVMQSKWERMTPRVRRYLLMAMMRAQRPLRLTAAGFAYMDNRCFLAIMKAAYSYYAVLSQKEV